MFSKPRINFLPSFSAAVTPETVQSTVESYSSDYIITTIIELSDYLISIGGESTLFGARSHDPFSPSLRTLRDRMNSGFLSLSPLQPHANEGMRVRETASQRTAKAPIKRPLEDFEDLYYAVLSRMLEFHQLLNARLRSGFNNLMDLVTPGGLTIAAFYETLEQWWDVLNTPEFVKAIDDAVRRSRVKHLHLEILSQVQHDDITEADGEDLLADLYDPDEYDGVQGLAWIGGWAPSMIGAWLEEKYYVVLSIEREAEASKIREENQMSKVSKKPNTPRSRKEGLQVDGISKPVDKPIDDAPVHFIQQRTQQRIQRQAEREVQRRAQREAEQRDEEEGLQRSREIEEQLEYALQWEIKAQKVKQYTQHLREAASQRARYMVQSTVYSSDMYVGTFADNEDTKMGDY